jgi:dihydroflavonol-4-reductase
MKSLVIGATGFIGFHVMHRLLDEGHEVRCLLRPSSDPRRLAGHSVEVCIGDVTDSESIARAVEGCRWVFHAGGRISFWSGDAAWLERDHVLGSIHVADACQRVGARLIYTGSVATLGRPADDGAVGDETTPFDWNPRMHPYAFVKHEAANRLCDAVARGLDVVIVMPTTTFGANDFNLSAARMIVDVDRGKIFGYPAGGMTVAHAAAVAAGHVQAAATGRCGERYVLGGDHLLYQELFAMIAREVGRRAPLFRLPGPVLTLIGAGGSAASSLLRRDLGLTRTTALLGQLKLYYSSAKAIREIGYHPLPASAAVREACSWYREQVRARPAA